MAGLILCCVLLLAGTALSDLGPDTDRLVNAHSNLARQTFDVIEQAFEAQQETFDQRIDALEARVTELEEMIAEGVPAGPVVPNEPVTHAPPMQPQPEPEPQPKPEPEPAPTTTTQAPTTVRRTTTRSTTTTTRPPPPVVTTPETCQDLFDRGETTNDWYTIDPKNTGAPFAVYCNFDGGEAKTVVHHNKEEEEKNNNNKNPGTFVLTPVYRNADTNQLAALTDVSASCQQFIKLRCKAAVLFIKKGTDYGWWISRDGETMRSWGGAPASADSRACAGGRSCRCDNVGKGETSDEGLLTDKEYLPVKSVYLGDTGGRKQTSWLTLGELVCTGKM
ncbi:contactin-associated protein-like 2 isoform X2 [Acanthaster planci]|nr:contactin-associated protein-like 2 isoform X2 [Acanthaster planci]